MAQLGGFTLIGIAAGVALLALAALAWQLRQRQTFLREVTTRRRWLAPLSTGGGWNRLRQLFYRQQQHAHARQRRLLNMLRNARKLADVLPDAVVVVERQTQRIQWLNPAASTLLGLNAQDLGAPLAARLSPLPLAHWLAGGRHAEPILDAVSPLDPALRLQLRLLAWSGQHWLLLARDVSKLLHLEQVRRDFVANVSHELRTPLTVLHGYLELLDANDLSARGEETAPILAEMRAQSERMRHLVDDLLTLSRLESPAQIAAEPIAMSALMASLLREAKAHSQGQHEIRLHEQASVDLLGCSKDLHSAFSNLVSNAVRYTPAGGQIELSFCGDADGAVFSVRDTGPGIPAEHLPRLSERFYRISRSRSSNSGGTGLGLAIVKHVLSLHRARLVIDSAPGQGSTFACHFDAGQVCAREIDTDQAS